MLNIDPTTLLLWAGFGAFIGYGASLQRGLPTVAGLLGGALLGPLAFLMFFVSGVGGPSVAHPRTVKCPFCAEQIQAEAIICKHCQREVTTA